MKSCDSVFYHMSRVPFSKKHMKELWEANMEDGLLRGNCCTSGYGGLWCIMMLQTMQGAVMSASMSVNHRSRMRCRWYRR